MANHHWTGQGSRDNWVPAAGVLVVQGEVVEICLVNTAQKKRLQKQGANDLVFEQDDCEWSDQVHMNGRGGSTWKHGEDSHFPLNKQEHNQRASSNGKHTYHHGRVPVEVRPSARYGNK